MNVNKSLSDWNSKVRVAKKIEDSEVPLTQEEYGKLVREAEDILKKRHLYSQRHNVLNVFQRDNQGNLCTEKISSLKDRLGEARRQHMNMTVVLYVFVSIAALFIGMNL